MVSVVNLLNSNRHEIEVKKNFHVIEYDRDISCNPQLAQVMYFMSEMNIRKRQLLIQMNDDKIIIQAGAMHWLAGNIHATTGIKGVRDFAGKLMKGAVTNESAIKPEYAGTGLLMLEPTYKHIILQDVSEWGPTGVSVEDGMFLAAEGSVKQSVVARRNISSAVAGGEGLFNMSLSGNGIAALESPVPYDELIEVQLNGDELKVDGNFAVCWSSSLSFTVERSGKTLIGSAASGEGLVNVYRGSGRVLLAPVL